MVMGQRLKAVKMPIHPMLIYRFSEIHVKTPAAFFYRYLQAYSKVFVEMQKT